MKCWNISEHVAFQKIWLSLLLRVFDRGKNLIDYMFGNSMRNLHQHLLFYRHSHAFVILGHQEIHHKYDCKTFEAKTETELRLWKVGMQVVGSVQRKCS